MWYTYILIKVIVLSLIHGICFLSINHFFNLASVFERKSIFVYFKLQKHTHPKYIHKNLSVMFIR